MDELGGLSATWWTTRDVNHFFRQEQKLLNSNKKAIELWAGMAFSMLMSGPSTNRLVGLPRVNRPKTEVGPTIPELIGNPSSILDEDFDVLVRQKNADEPDTVWFCQVTRDVKGDLDSIRRLLEKKYRVQVDRTLDLVVLLQGGFACPVEDLWDKLQLAETPYGSVNLIGLCATSEPKFKALGFQPWSGGGWESGEIMIHPYPVNALG